MMKPAARRHQIALLRKRKQRLEAKIERLETQDRREAQADSLALSSNAQMPFLSGSINVFSADLVYHAKRLNRSVSGVFNQARLTAYPETDPNDLVKRYSVASKG